MFDFKRLASTTKSDLPASLGELFGQLDRKTTHSSLRPVQVSAFRALDSQSEHRDSVIKLSTGSGKTVVGLVYAEMMRRKYRGEPSVFLCPTNQLVEQVVQGGKHIGVHVVSYTSTAPLEALSGEAVLACTYDRVFNARSTFESKNIRPSCFVLDDVHAGVERVRGCFTARVPQRVFAQLVAMLRPLCEASDRAAWHAITTGSAGPVYEVPYWIWANVYREVFPLLEELKDDSEEEREMLETLLEHVGFGGHDRLISVGDLVDRGPDSMGLLRLFHSNPNFFAVVGNHDALMWGAFQNHMEAQKGWRGMGNEWSYPLSDEEKRFAVEVVGTFPLGMEVPLPDGCRVAVIHAGVRPGATWRDVCDWESDWIDVTLDYELRHDEYAIWGRHHSVAAIQAMLDLPNLSLWEKLKIHEGLQPLADVDLLVSGHTPLPGRKPLLGANRLFIDTGGYHKDGCAGGSDSVQLRR